VDHIDFYTCEWGYDCASLCLFWQQDYLSQTVADKFLWNFRNGRSKKDQILGCLEANNANRITRRLIVQNTCFTVFDSKTWLAYM